MDNFSCAICLNNLSLNDRIFMPCCGVEGSTIQYCKFCIETIATHGVNGFGKCPTCSSWYTIRNNSVVKLGSIVAECHMCRQHREIVDNNRVLCDKCLLGSELTFEYVCERCNRNQRIPHPMWLYQPSATEFGTATWACHRGCGDYTHWRITDNDASRIPMEHLPQAWGRREDWLETVRQRSQHLQQYGDRSTTAANDQANVDHICCIS